MSAAREQTEVAGNSLTDLGQTLTEAPRQTLPAKGPKIEQVLPWVDIFSKLATVAVLLFAYLQYDDARQDARRERAMKLVDEWVQGGQPDRLARISDYIETAARNAKPQIDALPEAMRARAWANAEGNTVATLAQPKDEASKSVRGDIDQLLRFFARAEICTSSGLCDAEVVEAYFLVEAQSIRTELAPLIAKIRAEDRATYGKALDAFIATVEPQG